MQPLNAEDFLIGLKSGNKKIILEIYKESFPGVEKFILNNHGSISDSDEIFQEALFQLTLKLQTKDILIKTSFQAYFFTVCKNLWRKELIARKKWVRNDSLITLKSKEDDFQQSTQKEEQWQLFEEKINELSENCRNLLKDYFQKAPYKLIVKKYNYSSENVAFQRMFKCKKKLKDLITKDKRFKNLEK